MKVLWIDPINSDPQFLNLVSSALYEMGHDVHVISNRRNLFPPHQGVDWTRFSSVSNYPDRLQDAPAKAFAITIAYAFDWMRAAWKAKRSGAKAALVTTSLHLPRLDALGLLWLRLLGVVPMVIMHKPYPGFFEDQQRRKALRYRAFYGKSDKIMVMTVYSKRLLAGLYGLEDSRFILFRHPSLEPILMQVGCAGELHNQLQQWASGRPVISYTATLDEAHGFELFLESLRLLSGCTRDFRVIVLSRAKAGPERDAVESEIRKRGLGDLTWCHFEPYTYETLKTVLDMTSIVVAPYKWCTQSGVVATAVGRSIPVLATAAGGLPEMIAAGVSGELAPVGDAPQMSERLLRMIKMIGTYKEGAALHARLSSPQIVSGLQRVVDALASAPSTRH